MLDVGVLVRLLVGLLAVVSCKSSDAPTPGPTSSPSGLAIAAASPSLKDATPVGSVDAITLTADFENQVRASQVYAGKVYDVQGVLDYAQDHGDLGLGPHLSLKGAKYVDVACQFAPSELAAVAKLAPHTKVTIRGVITGKNDGRFVYVQPCIVAPAP